MRELKVCLLDQAEGRAHKLGRSVGSRRRDTNLRADTRLERHAHDHALLIMQQTTNSNAI